MDDLTRAVRALAERVAETYLDRTEPRAILLVGSGATGGIDRFSDVDMLLYYDGVPADTDLAAARRQLGAKNYSGTNWPDGMGFSERYDVDGIHCQLGHAVIAGWEREIDRLVDELDLDPALLKEVSGLFEGRPLHGEDLIVRWRDRAAYTERLQRAIVQKHWRFFPWWYYQEKLEARDAPVWRYDVLVQAAYNLSAILAALNRIYFSNLEYKRLSRFVSSLEVAPQGLDTRLRALFDPDEKASTAELERLVFEVQGLVAERFPDIDLAIEWAGRPTPPGSREAPTQPRTAGG